MKRSKNKAQKKMPESPVVSGTECTGLTMSMPLNDAEADAYADLYRIPLVPDSTDDIPKP